MTQEIGKHHYYPFGMEMDGPWMGTPGRESKYRYNGKELNSELDLNWLDYGARWYDASIGRWNAVDPLAESTPGWTPYRYGFNNPLLFIDPNGESESPIYDEEGNFLGVDSEGFTGNIVVMSEAVYNRLTNGGENTLDHSLTSSLVENTTVASNLDEANISVEAVSNILTHTVKQMVGETVNGEKLNFDKLEGGIVNVVDFPVNEDGEMGDKYGASHGNFNRLPVNAEASTTTSDGVINVTTATLAGKSQFNTVEHAQSVLGIHEYYGHGLKGVPQAFPGHGRAYSYEFNHKRTYNKLSGAQKRRINENKN